MRLIFFFALFAALIGLGLFMSADARAKDPEGEFFSARSSCSNWLDIYSNGRKLGYVEGYMTAINIAVLGKKDFFESTDARSIVLYIDKYCTENPLKDSSYRMEKLLYKLLVPFLN